MLFSNLEITLSSTLTGFLKCPWRFQQNALMHQLFSLSSPTILICVQEIKEFEKRDILLHRYVSKTFATVGCREIGLKLNGSWTSQFSSTATIIASFRQAGELLSSIHLNTNFASTGTITHSIFCRKKLFNSKQSVLYLFALYLLISRNLLISRTSSKVALVSRIDFTLILVLLEKFCFLDSKFDAKVLPTEEKRSLNLSTVSLLSLSCVATLPFNLLMQSKKDKKISSSSDHLYSVIADNTSPFFF